MKNVPKKKPKAISSFVVQAELMRELVRENIALANDTLELVRQLRELHDYAIRIMKAAPAAAGAPRGRVIPFSLPPHRDVG